MTALEVEGVLVGIAEAEEVVVLFGAPVVGAEPEGDGEGLASDVGTGREFEVAATVEGQGLADLAGSEGAADTLDGEAPAAGEVGEESAVEGGVEECLGGERSGEQQ